MLSLSLPRLSCLALALSSSLGAALSRAAEPIPEGPAVSLRATSSSVCAHYSASSGFDLYRDSIELWSGSTRVPLRGLPPARIKTLGSGASAVRLELVDAPFSVCAALPAGEAPVAFLDQSCRSSSGECLPPRGWLIERGRVSPLSAQRASALFHQGFSAPASDPWAPAPFAPRSSR